MNVNPDSPSLPDAEGSAPEAAEVVAKPARRPRTPKVVVDAAAAVDTIADTAPDDASAAATEPPPKPKRRRAVPVEAAGDAASAEPRSEAPAEAPVSADVQPAPAPHEAVRAEADDEGRRDERGEAQGEAQREAPGEASSEAQAESQGQTPGEGQRSRRRNRRDRKRGERGEMGADQSDRPPVAVDPAAVAAAAAQQASEVFAHVVSGDFDVEGEEEPADEADAATSKRVLAPEPEAPKLHKVLAQAGIGSRRDMEELILDGRITVNDEPAHIGQRISFGDQVKVSGKPVKLRIMPLPARIIAYHKPVGEIVTHDDPQNRPTVFRRLPRLQQGKWQSVGRLDINTEGLLLFTTSGELANQLMHPRFGVEREYAVRVLGTLTPEAKAELIEGVMVEGQKCGFRSIEDGGGEGANHWYRVVITEGRNREVRKLFDVVGLTVSRLIRIRYGNVVLPHGLKRGAWVDLEDADVRAIRRLASGNNQGQQRDGQQGGRGNNERQGGQPPQKQRNDRQGGRPNNDRGRGNNPQGRFNEPQPNAAPQGNEPERDFERDSDSEDIDFDPRSIPNPLEQTFDKRFVQNPRSPAGGRGFGRGGGGFGAGGSAPPAQKKGPGPAQPDPLQTSLGFIGADAFHRKGNRGGGGGGRGGNRGGGGGGGGGGFGGGGGGYGGGGGGGGGRRGR